MTDEFARYRDHLNHGAVQWCGDCGAPCDVVRPGKTQCGSCDWWRFAEESPFVQALARLRAADRAWTLTDAETPVTPTDE